MARVQVPHVVAVVTGPKVVHRVRWAMIHTGLLLFGLDFLAALWPWFGAWWEHRQHLAIGFAAFSVALAEFYLPDPLRRPEQ